MVPVKREANVDLLMNTSLCCKIYNFFTIRLYPMSDAVSAEFLAVHLLTKKNYSVIILFHSIIQTN